MSDEKSKARAEKRRQQRARQALEAFLAKLRNTGGTIEKIEQWEEYTQSLEIIFHQYEYVLPIEACARLCNTIQTAHGVTEGFGDAYKIMQTKVEQVIPLLPPTKGSAAKLTSFILSSRPSSFHTVDTAKRNPSGESILR